MKENEEGVRRKCPKCGKEDKQMNSGFTVAGSQRCLCGYCKCKYTPNPRKWVYTGEERKQALRLIMDGVTGRGVGRQMNMSKANVYRWAREEAKKGTL